MAQENKNIFDFIASLLSELGEEALTRYASDETRSYVIDAVHNEFISGFINDIKAFYTSNNEVNYKNLVMKGIPLELFNKYTANTEFRKNTDAVYQLARMVASNLLEYEGLLKASREAYDLARYHQNSIGFNQLNSDDSVEKTGFILLPNLGTIGDKNNINKTTTTFEKILLKGLIVLKSSDLRTRNGQQYKVKNIVPLENSHVRSYSLDKIVTIAVSPISDQWLLLDKPVIRTNERETKEYYFQLEGVSDKELIHKRVELAYKEACEQEAHILVFPEMLGTNELSNNADVTIESEADQIAPLVVMPSWWHDNKNEAAVLDESLITLFQQEKQSRFVSERVDGKYKAPSREDLRDQEHIVYLYHFPEIGRVCVCICKDFLTDSYRRMLSESLEASFILIPAFSPEIEHFKNCLGELRHAGTYGVFINCCAAYTHRSGEYTQMTKNDTVGEITLTRSVGNDDDPPLRLLHPKCGGNCGDKNTCCVFIIRITDEGLISVKHSYKQYDREEGRWLEYDDK